MMDDLRLGPDASANHALSLLRRDAAEGRMEETVRLGPGLHLRSDPDLRIGGMWRSPPGRVLDLEIRPEGPGRWFGLHLGLGGGDLSDCGVIGFACRTAAPGMRILRACLRSGTADGFVDCFFDKHILSHETEATHLDALPAHGRDSLPLTAPWRELVIFLPTEEFDWSLIDLRLFAV